MIDNSAVRFAGEIAMSDFKLPPEAEVGTFDGDPFVWRPGIALVFRNGSWVDDPTAWMAGRPWPVKDWLAEFSGLPPIPKEDFHSGDKLDGAAEQSSRIFFVGESRRGSSSEIEDSPA